MLMAVVMSMKSIRQEYKGIGKKDSGNCRMRKSHQEEEYSGNGQGNDLKFSSNLGLF